MKWQTILGLCLIGGSGGVLVALLIRAWFNDRKWR